MTTTHSRCRPVVLGVALACYGSLVRPKLLRWGATAAEYDAALPGDELIRDADSSSTMATTLPAPPELVWPWLAQMGCNRGGWYSWDRVDNGGTPSADRIHPEWQNLTEGQRLDSVPSGRTWFTVARLEPERTLVLRAQLRLPSGRPMGRSEDRSHAYVDSVWGFHLSSTPAGQTRLVVRTRGHARPRWLTRAADLSFWEPAHLIMQLRQFHNLRRRVGGGVSAQRSVSVTSPGRG